MTKHLSWKGKLEKDMLDTSKSGACVLSSRDRLHSLAWHCDIVHILGWPAIDESEEFPMISPLVKLRRQPQENHGWLPTAKLLVSMPEPYHAISAQTSKHSLCSGFSIHFLYPFILSCLEISLTISPLQILQSPLVVHQF